MLKALNRRRGIRINSELIAFCQLYNLADSLSLSRKMFMCEKLKKRWKLFSSCNLFLRS